MESLQFHLRKPRPDNPWGFRIQGGRDFNRPLVISRITSDSVANQKGLKCGDEIIGINNEVAACLSHYQAQELIIQSGDELRLEIVRTSSSGLERPIVTYKVPCPSTRSPVSKNTPRPPPRTGCATNVQMSHSNFDLTHRTPICRSCSTEIRGPFIIVLDYCFCPNHFNCDYCHSDLAAETFIEIGGLFYCEKDYSKYMAPKCHKCNTSIVTNEITAINTKWHSYCFNCNRCGINLGETMFKIGDDNLPYCLSDWNDLFQVKCSRCQQSITVLDKFIEIDQSVYHAKCFTCSACKIPLDGKSFHKRNGKPFCKVHAFARTMY